MASLSRRRSDIAVRGNAQRHETVSNTLNIAHSLIMADDETGLRSGTLLGSY